MSGSSWDAVSYRERVTSLIADLARAIDIDMRDRRHRTWLTGLHEVPRHLFVPARAWAASFEERGTSHLIDRDTDRTSWLNAVYSNYSIVTQRDDGATDVADTGGSPTCSLSCPAISLPYLLLLDLDQHHRVLEIGTGTGWTAGMLSWRLSDRQVVTVEVDAGLAETARGNLKQAGREPLVVAGDGADGYGDWAPYDRVHVTCGVREVPYAWVEQTRPGGLIVAPYQPMAGGWGQQLVLDVLDDGTAQGRFVGGGGFMMLRSQRAGVAGPPGEEPDRAVTRMDPRLISSPDGGAQLAIVMRCGHLVVESGWEQRDGAWVFVVRLADRGGGSWASCVARKGAAEFEVLQAGERCLWDEAQDAYMWWLRAGKPGRERYGMSVGPGGQEIWLDCPR